MSSMAHLTIETGGRPIEQVKAEVEQALEEPTDDEDSRYPEVYEHHGNVAATRSYKASDLNGVDVPRVIWTTFNDTSDGGVGNLHERLGDQFYRVEEVSSPYSEGRYGGYVGDFYRINYGIFPRYGYEETPHVGQISRPRREDWHSILSIGDDPPMSPEEVGGWLDGNLPDRLDLETLRALLDYDPYYRAAGHLFANEARTRMSGPDSESLFDQLDQVDDAERTRIVRAVWACGTDDTDQYKEMLMALRAVDERTKALIAPKLWDPTPLTDDDEPPDPSLLTALLELVDDPVPELRVGAIMGASMVLGQLQKAVMSGTIEADAAFDGVVEPFYEALRTLMSDPDVRVRERAVTMTDEFIPVTDERIPEFVAANILRPITKNRLDFQDRWAFARAVAETAAEPTSETPDRGVVLAGAFDGEPEAVPTLVEYAYDERGPYYERVLGELAMFAEDHPDAALDALEPALNVIEQGTETTADVRLLEALAHEVPDRVAPAAPYLEALLDDEDAGDKRRAAARTLKQLPDEAVNVDTATLAEATMDVFNEFKLDAERVASLAEVSPDETVDLLTDLPDEMVPDGHDKVKRRHIERSLRTVSEVDTDVVATVLPEMDPLFEDLPQAGRHLPIALATTAVDHPELVGQYAHEIGELLANPDPLLREAAATALVVVGRQKPAVVPEPLDALVERAHDAIPVDDIEESYNDPPAETPPDWPVGAVATQDPDYAVDIVRETLSADRRMSGEVDALVLELAAGNESAAERVLDTLLAEEQVGLNQLSGVVEDAPELLSRFATVLVERLAEEDDQTDPSREVNLGLHPRTSAKHIENALAAAAAVGPEAVQSAVRSQYGSVDAFVDAFPTDNRRTIEEHLTDNE